MFNTPEEFGQYLQNIIDRHREDLSILLRRNNIEGEPTPLMLLTLYQLYGDEFLEMLAGLPLQKFDGKLADIFSKGAAIVSKVGNVANAVTGKSGSATTTTPAPAASTPAPSKTKKIVIGGAIIVVVLIVVLVIVKKLKK
jgi:hypothetical protein